MSRPHALVIGRQGQVAMALARVLPVHGIGCTIVSRPVVDLTQPDTLERVIAETRPDVVINAAAYTAVDRAEDEPELAFLSNGQAPGVMAAAAALVGAAIIHISTDYVFDGASSVAYREGDPVGPLGIYGRSKLAGEVAVAAANPRHIILRTAWVCSPDGGNFVKTMLKLAAERPELKVVNDQTGVPTFAADIAEVIASMVRVLDSSACTADQFGIFHVASAGETTWCGFARAIMAGSQLRGGPHVPVRAISTADFPTKARRPAYSKLNTGKLAAVYKLSLPEWDQSLDQCLDALICPVR